MPLSKNFVLIGINTSKTILKRILKKCVYLFLKVFFIVLDQFLDLE